MHILQLFIVVFMSCVAAKNVTIFIYQVINCVWMMRFLNHTVMVYFSMVQTSIQVYLRL